MRLFISPRSYYWLEQYDLYVYVYVNVYVDVFVYVYVYVDVDVYVYIYRHLIILVCMTDPHCLLCFNVVVCLIIT